MWNLKIAKKMGYHQGQNLLFQTKSQKLYSFYVCQTITEKHKKTQKIALIITINETLLVRKFILLYSKFKTKFLLQI